MLKNQKGITLVALVITIVILIILATVSITLALNSNLIGHAQTGSEEYSDAANTEHDELLNLQAYVNAELNK